MSETRERVWWTNDEKDLVCEAMAERIRLRPGARFKEVWEAGNAILASDRQRRWYSSYSGQHSPLHGLFAEARKRAQVAEQHAVPPHQEAAEEEREAEITWVPVPTPQRLEEVPLKELLAECIGRLLERWSPLTGEALKMELNAERRTLSVDAVTARDRMVTERVRPVRIGICGLLPAQFRRVKEQINARKVELVWVDNQQNPSMMDWKGGIDYAIVTRFIRHGHHEQAKAVVGGERVVWCASGVESVVEAVEGWVKGARN